jgi:hypothetical protein
MLEGWNGGIMLGKDDFILVNQIFHYSNIPFGFNL